MHSMQFLATPAFAQPCTLSALACYLLGCTVRRASMSGDRTRARSIMSTRLQCTRTRVVQESVIRLRTGARVLEYVHTLVYSSSSMLWTPSRLHYGRLHSAARERSNSRQWDDGCQWDGGFQWGRWVSVERIEGMSGVGYLYRFRRI